MKSFDYRSEGAYFITLCTLRREPCLSSILLSPPTEGNVQKAQVILLPYGEIAERYLLSMPGIAQYVIMPNHIHAILFLNSAEHSLPQLVRSYKTMVTKAVGKPLFQRSFFDHVIRGEKDFHSIQHYIDHNPSQWAEDRYFSPTIEVH